MTWKSVAVSVEGKSHHSAGTSCQDSSICMNILTSHGQYLILIASDGCGSSRHSQLGSQIITKDLLECISFWLRRTPQKPDLIEIINHSLGHAHQVLSKKSIELRLQAHELAATCLCLVVGPSTIAAAQIGDGAIIGERNGIFGCVFWPNQEYANVTKSLTDPQWYKHVQLMDSTRNDGDLEGWLLVTDGVQSIACDYEKKVPHLGFVSGLVSKLRILPPGSERLIKDRLVEFLRSDKINRMVSDDKTIVVACS